MIEENVKIHDRYQFEIKLNYGLERDKKTTSYDVESYLFVPNSLGINRYTYKKEDFYNDIQSYIRFKTPEVLLKHIAEGANAPLDRLNTVYDTLANEPTQKNISNFEYQTKMCSSIIKSALRDHADFVISRSNVEDTLDAIRQYIDAVRAITVKFRKLRHIINVPSVKQEVFSIFLFADEYISLLIEKYTYRLLEYLKNKNIDKREEYRQELLDLIRREIEYRKKNEYYSIATEDSDNESLMFRYSVLKKYIESVLFLNVSRKPEGKFLEQFLISIAAGLAMVFATAVTFFSLRKYGNYTLPVFIILVISYMFKDRIKGLTRQFLTSSVLRMLYDHKTKIYIEPARKIGVCRESFDFMKPNQISGEVLGQRNRQKTKEFDNKFAMEKIIRYRKHIDLFPRINQKIYHDYAIEGINDILRFNVSRFLSRMDNPRKPIFVLTSDGYKQIMGKRVYHVNMIIKYQMGDESELKHFRLILSRNGINRIEEVQL